MPKEQSRDKERMRVVREIALLKTLAVTICAFLICWLPYGIIALFFADTVPPQVKKVITNLCLGENYFYLILVGWYFGKVLDDFSIAIALCSPSCFGQETAKGSFGLRVKLPTAHLSTTTRWRLHTVPLIAERPSGKL